MLTLVLLLGIALAAAVTDLGDRRIPNALTYPAIVAGLVLGFVPGEEVGIAARAAGAAIAFVPAFLLFLGRAIGGGDVKLLAAVGAIAGVPLVFDVLFYAVLAGGVLAIGLLIAHGRLFEMVRGTALWVASAIGGVARPPVPAADLSVPFGTAVLAGVVWTIAPVLGPALPPLGSALIRLGG